MKSEKLKSAVWAILALITLVVLLSLLNSPPNKDRTKPAFKKIAVRIETPKAKKMVGDVYLPAKPGKTDSVRFPGAVLLAPAFETREIYAPLAIELSQHGVAVLSVELIPAKKRNSGKSFDPQEIGDLPMDAWAAVKYFKQRPEIDSTKLAILGTELTGRSALIAASLNPHIKGVVLVSAVLDSTGFRIIRMSPQMAVLVMVSLQDGPAGFQAKSIYEASQNPNSDIESYINAGRGAEIWWSQARLELTQYIANWLEKKIFKLSS